MIKNKCGLLRIVFRKLVEKLFSFPISFRRIIVTQLSEPCYDVVYINIAIILPCHMISPPFLFSYDTGIIYFYIVKFLQTLSLSYHTERTSYQQTT